MRGQQTTLSARLIGALGLLLGVGFLLVSTPALAANTHLFLETFGSVNQPSFTQAEGLAVDQSSGDLLVIDGEANTISRFNPDGTSAEFSALGSNVIDGQGAGDETPQGGLAFGSPGEVQVAIDNSGGATDGNIYVPQAGAKVVDVFGKDGSFLGQLSESSEGSFSEPCGVTVDPTGSVYVGDFSGHIHKYEPVANPPVNADNTANLTFSSQCTLAAGAGSTVNSIFPVRFNGSVSKLDSTSGEEKYVVAPGSNTTDTVDPVSGHVLAAAGSEVTEYDASSTVEATLLSSFSSSDQINGLAVNGATGNVYVARAGNANIELFGPPVALPEAETGAASEVDEDSAVLNGTVGAAGGPDASCEFQYTTEAAFEEEGFEGATSVPCVPPGPFTGSTKEAVSAVISGLVSGTRYRFRVVASNENGFTFGEALSLFALGPPVISGETVSAITVNAARISGLIDPVGAPTSFVVQYVTEAEFLESGYTNATSVPVPAKEVGSGTEFVEIAQQLTSLAPNTTYHFRLVATNIVETVEGSDRTFTTFAKAPPGLPDGRAYEMVSPAEKSGEVFPPEPAREVGSSCPLECLPGLLRPMAPMQSTPDGEAVVYEGQPFAAGQASAVNEYLAKRAPGGWETEDLSSPLFQQFENQGFKAFSSDLSRGVVFQIQPALSAEAPTQNGTSYANLYLWQGTGTLRPLVTKAPPHRSSDRLSYDTRFDIFYEGANSGTSSSQAFSHVIFAANDALTDARPPFAPEAPEVEGAGSTSAGCLLGENCNLYEWVNGQLRLVNVLPGNTTTAPRGVIGSRPSEDEPPAVDHAISDDGERIFWSDESGQVFVRINSEETQEIEDPGRFLTASTDGSRVLLGDGCLYDLQDETCEELSEGKGGFQGILGASDDLSRVYFVDTAVLSEEENPNGEEAEVGEFNLYVWDKGAIAYIGTLLEADNPPRIGDWRPSSTRRTAQVSLDGRYLAFMSKAPLTGYDNNLNGGGQCLRHSETSACNEVFEYDANLASLVCASCNPNGQQPIGESNLSLIKELVPIPAAPFSAPHNLTTEGQGRLFFESQDALSPLDTNGHIQDVYEWEPNEVGSCKREGGCLFLISSGHGTDDSMFFNSTPSGDDGLFVTREKLLLRDKDEKLDVYDARAPHTPGEAVGFPEGEIAPCGGEACKGPIPGAPFQPNAGSSGFSSSGNAKSKPACKRGFVRKRGKCVKKTHKSHHGRSNKHNRGGSK